MPGAHESQDEAVITAEQLGSSGNDQSDCQYSENYNVHKALEVIHLNHQFLAYLFAVTEVRQIAQ